MKKALLIAVLVIFGCSKKNDFPAGSTNATVDVYLPNGRHFSFSDYSVKGGSLGYTFDGGTNIGNHPIDYVTDIPASFSILEYFQFNFSGYHPNNLYQLRFGVPTASGVTDLTEDPSTWPSGSAAMADVFSLNIYGFDTTFVASKLQVTTSGIPSGAFLITFNVDSVWVGNNVKVAYPTPGTVTIKGIFNNVGLL
jgi:hypothetical protein